MIEIKITLKEIGKFEDNIIKATTIETHVQSKGIKSTIGERKVYDEIKDFIQSI